MLLIVTLALVLVAAVTLVMGIFGNHLQPIYISIVCSFVAAILLAVISRLNRRKPSDVTTADAPAPLPADEPEPGESARSERSPSGKASDGEHAGPTEQLPAVGAHGERVSESTSGPGPRDEHWAHQQQWAQQQQWAHPEEGRRETARPEAAPGTRTGDESAKAGIFPIEDYDDLRIGEILPLLDELDTDELTEVREREHGGQRRSAVLDRIDERLGRRPGAAEPVPGAGPESPAAWPATGAVVGSAVGAAAAGPAPGASPARQDGPRGGAMDGAASEPQQVAWPATGAVVGSSVGAAASGPAPGASTVELDGTREGADAPAPARPPGGGAEAPSEGETPFPIENYDELRVAQILILLTQLDGGELERVAAHEREGAKRNTILNRIDRLRRSAPA